MRALIDRATKAVETLVAAVAAAGALIVVVQMVWISHGVFMRYAMGSPDRMVTEATALLLFPVALLGLAYALREDSYPRVTLVTDAISEAMPGGAHGSTFGGNPLACRVGTETLRVLAEDNLYENARVRGEAIRAGIEALDSPKVRAVRGSGMMIGIELKAKATPTLKALQERGVLALMAGNLVIRLLPPVIYGQEQVDELLAALGDVLTA